MRRYRGGAFVFGNGTFAFRTFACAHGNIGAFRMLTFVRVRCGNGTFAFRMFVGSHT